MLNQDLFDLLSARRNLSLRRLAAPGPDANALRRILEAAAQAPDHGQLRPWRFILVPAQRRADLGAAFAQALAVRNPEADEEARARAFDKAFHAPCLLVAVLADAPGADVPRDEKLVSLGCAIQNMLLAAQALGFASGLASGAGMQAPALRQLLALGPHEQAICFIGFGSADAVKPPRQRPDPDEFFSSL
jgi:nitroreductase